MSIMAKISKSLTLALPLALLVAGCAVELQNTEMVARERARLAGPSGSVYTGWRIFQDKCASCHGSAATGGPGAPNLLLRVREMGPHRFVNLVLRRYDWNLPALPAAEGSAAREVALEAIVQRQQGGLTMPAWQGEPSVNVHVADLYAYLSARAAGTQGPGRPAP